MVGLLGLMAALVFQSPLYGFQAIAGYLHSVAYLRGRWRVVGVVVTALLVAYCQIGGRFVTTVSTGTVLGLLGLTVVNAAIERRLHLARDVPGGSGRAPSSHR